MKRRSSARVRGRSAERAGRGAVAPRRPSAGHESHTPELGPGAALWGCPPEGPRSKIPMMTTPASPWPVKKGWPGIGAMWPLAKP